MNEDDDYQSLTTEDNLNDYMSFEFETEDYAYALKQGLSSATGSDVAVLCSINLVNKSFTLHVFTEHGHFKVGIYTCPIKAGYHFEILQEIVPLLSINELERLIILEQLLSWVEINAPNVWNANRDEVVREMYDRFSQSVNTGIPYQF